MTPVPAAAANQLMPYVRRKQDADAALQAAVDLVLAAMGAPPGANIELRPDGTMFVVVPGDAESDAPAEAGEA